MNVISYINGDARITDFPTCSARPLSLLVQSCNDLLAGPDGYLSPKNSMLALELARQTVGTADVPDTVVRAWSAELLTAPTWGMLHYASLSAIEAIRDIADLHWATASGDVPTIVDWDDARRAARAINTKPHTAGLYAVRAAYESTMLVDTVSGTMDHIIVSALNAHALGSHGATANRIVEFTRHAIGSWRRLAKLDVARDTNPAPVQRALQLVG